MESFKNKFEEDTKTVFENLLESKFPFLEPVQKWKQTMWHRDGKLIICLVFSTKKLKFCFFNTPNLILDKLQRWGTTVFSQNLEIENVNDIDWEKIEALIDETIKFHK